MKGVGKMIKEMGKESKFKIMDGYLRVNCWITINMVMEF